MSEKRLPRLVVCNILIGTGFSAVKIIIEHCSVCGYSSDPDNTGHQACELAGGFVVHPEGCVEDNGIPLDTCPFPTVVEAATLEFKSLKEAIEHLQQQVKLNMIF